MKLFKIIIGLLMVVAITACCSQPKTITKTIYVPVTSNNDSLKYAQRIIGLEHYNTLLKDSIDSLKSMNTKIAAESFVANYKLNRIKYYINLVDKKPSQTKFLKGWIKRVLNN